MTAVETVRKFSDLTDEEKQKTINFVEKKIEKIKMERWALNVECDLEQSTSDKPIFNDGDTSEFIESYPYSYWCEVCQDHIMVKNKHEDLNTQMLQHVVNCHLNAGEIQ